MSPHHTGRTDRISQGGSEFGMRMELRWGEVDASTAPLGRYGILRTPHETLICRCTLLLRVIPPL